MAAVSPLTRNLYREDEVIASLRWCALKGSGKGKEAIFWAQELLDSGMRSAVYESLFWVWATGVAVANPGWLVEFRELCQKGATATDDEIQYCLMRLMRGGPGLRDTTPVVLLALGLDPQQCLADRVGQPALPPCSAATTPTLQTIARALVQGKAPLAWALARTQDWALGSPLWVTLAELSKWPAVIHLLENLHLWVHAHFDTGLYDLLARAAAISIAAFSKELATAAPAEPQPEWVAPTEWVADRYEWLHLTMRNRRIHVPPQSALYWFTARGSIPVNKTTEGELLNNLETCLRASTFWGPLLDPQPIWSDEARETFYDRYFINDIPDEWGAPYRLVSHGYGATPDVATPNYKHLLDTAIRRWFGAMPCAIWAGIDNAVPALKGAVPLDPVTGRPAELLGALRAAYEALEFPDPDPEILRPYRKVLTIL